MAECNSELSGRRSWSIPLTVIGPSPSSVRCSSEGRHRGRRRRLTAGYSRRPRAVLRSTCGVIRDRP
ncbi:hypothetical protein I552_10136 [Mycobacterium xenopi 3993]|nr:hypothetical protein I552_10136 [Mycobacterium xenopi 3993]